MTGREDATTMPSVRAPRASDPLLCAWCGQPILVAQAIFFLVPERKLVHQRCPAHTRRP